MESIEAVSNEEDLRFMKEAMKQAAEFFRAKGLKLLAAKVEDAATYKTCFNLGYDFSRGSTLQSRNW